MAKSETKKKNGGKRPNGVFMMSSSLNFASLSEH